MPGARSGRKLPHHYLITGPAHTQAQWWGRFKALLEWPDALIQLRPATGVEVSQTLAEKALHLAQEKGVPLIASGRFVWASRLRFDGLHLDSSALMALQQRPVSDELLLGASCHDPQELAQAQRVGVDFACLSPVFETRTHPESSANGLDWFRDQVKPWSFPVYALGGMRPENLPEVCAAGGHGIAAISAFWGDQEGSGRPPAGCS